MGNSTYPTAGQPRPHAVTSLTGTFNGITNPSFVYDANGNMTNRASSTQNIYWYSFNYPSSIAATDATGAEEVQFNYGPERGRWKQIYTGPSGTETTYYVGGGSSVAPALLDVVYSGGTTNYRYYLYAGAEAIGVYSRAGSTYTMNYALSDHQGSLSAFISGAGSKDVGESFSAFGQRRDPSTWSGPPSTADLNAIAGISRQGYTLHTWLGQSMGLNHMNGRTQDAILGRFISPDPHIQDPTNAQNYNRYSYVTSNPLTNVDPTGFKTAPKLPYCGVTFIQISKHPYAPECPHGLNGAFAEATLGGHAAITGVEGDISDNVHGTGAAAAFIGYVSGGSNASNRGNPDPNSGGSAAQSQTSDDLSPIVVTAQRMPEIQDTGDQLMEVTVLASATKEPTGEISPPTLRNAFPNPNAPYPQCNDCGTAGLKGIAGCWSTYGGGSVAGAACVLAWKEWVNQCVPNSC